MPMEELHREYPNRNTELRAVVKQCFEFGKTIAQEPSAAHSSGLDEHAIARQRQYLDHATNMVEALAAKPLPDKPVAHNPLKNIDLSEPYVYFTTNVEGKDVPLNEYTQLLAESWLELCAEMAKSQSAALAGSLVTYDHQRCVNNIEAISKIVDEIEERPTIDLPETAEPGAPLQRRSGAKK